MNDYEKNISDMGRETGILKRHVHPQHYYGDNVRKLFVTAAIVTLVTLPFFKDLISLPTSYYVVGVIFLVLIAGFTNPDYHWVVILDVVISLCGIFFFESEAISAYGSYDKEMLYFWTNQVLAFIFLTAFYYAAKTERGAWFGYARFKEK